MSRCRWDFNFRDSEIISSTWFSFLLAWQNGRIIRPLSSRPSSFAVPILGQKRGDLINGCFGSITTRDALSFVTALMQQISPGNRVQVGPSLLQFASCFQKDRHVALMTHFPGTFPTKGSQKNELKYIIILLLYDHNHASTTGLQKRLFVKGRERQGSCLYDNHIFQSTCCSAVMPGHYSL